VNNRNTKKNRKEKPSQKNTNRDYLLFAAVLAAGLAFLFIFPDKKEAATTTAWRYLREMMAILPAVMVIMGLFSVFISKEQALLPSQQHCPCIQKKASAYLEYRLKQPKKERISS